MTSVVWAAEAGADTGAGGGATSGAVGTAGRAGGGGTASTADVDEVVSGMVKFGLG